MRGLSVLLCMVFSWPHTGRCDAGETTLTRSDPAAITGGYSPAPHAGKPVKKQRPRRIRKRRPRCSGYASPKYRRMVRNWQKPPKIRKPRYRDGFRDLTLLAVNFGERLRVFPFLSDGGLDVDVLAEIRHLMRDKHTGEEHDIHPRLVKLLYRLATRFDARQINVISGYRASPDSGSESNHGKGRAVDFMIPGVPLAAVAREARKLGHVGVGFYPSSGFVHLDVRDHGPSYFWVDRSGPGLGPCTRRMLSSMASKMDRKWTPGKDEPEPERNRKGELLGATQKEPPENSEGG